MAYRDRQLIIDSLGHAWSATTVSAGTAAAVATAAISVTAATSHDRYHLTSLGWSIRNNGAAAYTATLNVSHATNTTVPTVIGSWDITPAAAGSLVDTYMVNFMGKRGFGLQAYFTTPAASVVQKVTACGFVEKGAF